MTGLKRTVGIALTAILAFAGCENITGGGADAPQDQNEDGSSVSLGTEHVLAAVNGRESDEFGWSVATFADVVIAGAPGVDGVNAVDRGAAYFFERTEAGTRSRSQSTRPRLTMTSAIPWIFPGFALLPALQKLTPSDRAARSPTPA
jgi:hypothetical protein